MAERHPEHASTTHDAAVAAREEESLRERWEATQAALRERFDEPIERATEITRRTLEWFPVRVWRHFLQHNGFLLAASISYQSLFAIFAVTYVAFASAGLWLGGSQRAVDALINLINSYIPHLISETGLIHPEAVSEVASSSTGVLAITGAVAVIVAIWTAIGFVTFARRAVRDIFGLPYDRRNVVVLKTRDFVAALVFGVALIVGAALGWVATGAIDFLVSLLGYGQRSFWADVLVRALSVIVAFAVNSAALAGLFRFLCGATLPWRTIWPGACLGGAATAVLQVGVGLLFVYTPSNPLLATFSVLVGFLLWFRLIGIVMLVAAAWIAIAATDRGIPLQQLSPAEQLVVEHAALLTAAQVRLRTALAARATAPWWHRLSATRAVRDAENELAQVERSAPPPDHRPLLG